MVVRCRVMVMVVRYRVMVMVVRYRVTVMVVRYRVMVMVVRCRVMVMVVLMKEREEEDDGGEWGSEIHCICQGIASVTALKVPGLCPFVLPIMVVWKQVRELGFEESKVMEVVCFSLQHGKWVELLLYWR